MSLRSQVCPDLMCFSRDEMIEWFDPAQISKSASSFNTKKLDWLNAHYMKTLPVEEVAKELVWHLNRIGVTDLSQGPAPELVVKNYAERTHTLKEMAQKVHYLFEDFDSYEEKGVKKWMKEGSVEVLEQSLKVIENCEFTPEALDKALEELAVKLEIGMGKVGQPLRIALTGTATSPGIGDTLCLVGKQRALSRIEKAIEHFKNLA